MINPDAPIPLYRQLFEELCAQIAAGRLGEGARLPSEPALARAHGIGRPTVRQATELLVQRGLVERRRGSGTFVRRRAPRVDLFSLSGTLASFQHGGLPLRTRLLERVRLRPVPPLDPENPFAGREAFTFVRLGSVAATMGLRAAASSPRASAAPEVVARRPSAGARPTLLEQVFLDPGVFPDLHRERLAGVSLSRLVEERYHLRPSHAEQSFRAILAGSAPAHAREALGLGPREPALLVKRRLHFPKAPSAIFSEITCRTDGVTFYQTVLQTTLQPSGAEIPHG
jgi:GntR family transcriptional regulator